MPALAVFKEAALKAPVAKAAEEMRVGNKVGSGEVLTLRKENQKQQMKATRQANTKPTLSLALTRAAARLVFGGSWPCRAALSLMGMSRQLIPPQRLGSGASAAVERR